MLINKKYNTKPLLIHNPLESDSNGGDVIWSEISCAKFCSIPNNLTVVTWNSKSEESLLEKQLNGYKIKFINLAKNLNWTSNRLKPLTFLQAEIQTDYVLGLDAYDVFIIRDLCSIIDKFQKYKCEALFNATTTIYPICSQHKLIEEKIAEPPFQFFNSGMFVGNTKYIKNVFRKIDWNDNREQQSDQFLIRQVYHKDSNIKLDYRCEIFQIGFMNKPNKISDYINVGSRSFI